MSDRDRFGFWITLSEGGEWVPINGEDVSQFLDAKVAQTYAGEVIAAFGIRVGGKDRVYDFILNRWRGAASSTLPDKWFS